MEAPGPAEGHWTDLDQDSIVLGLLLECADDFVPGQVLCDKLDMPRAELLQRIDSLRARGYVIRSSGGRGYRLSEVPDTLAEASLAPLLSTHELGRRVAVHAELDSTNEEAHRLAESGAAHGTVVLADFQRRGRGRRGRSWVSPPGKGLALSVVLRPTLSPAQAPELTLVAAVAVCEAARELGAVHARIKWPNDLECNGRKLAGLLCELRTDEDLIRHAVLGVGLNVGLAPDDLPAELRHAATSLLIETGEQVSRLLACARVLEHLEEWLELHEAEGFGLVRERWRALSSTLGRRVRVVLGEQPAPANPDSPRAADPEAALEGEALDLAEDGALLVRGPDGAVHRVVAGDVEHCTPL